MDKVATSALALVLAFSPSQGLLAQAPSAPNMASAPASQSQNLSDAQLDALVAPIALYPDALLSEVLMASTYPLEIVEADRWAQANKSLKGDALKAAVDQQGWDDSVKSLVATPDVLDMMSRQLSWTQQLGDAVLAQQADVMDAIQRLRSKAQANNKLVSTQQQTVSTEEQNGSQVIVIAPAQPDTIYVPYYNPAVVYGPWPYPAYPPYYWPAPGYIAAGVLATGLAFGAGYALGRWVGGGYWGGGFNWGNNNININRNININNINRGNGNNWVHNPIHRQGVRYNNPDVANRFGGNRNNIGGGAQNRMDFRGRGGNQVLQPGGGAGNRPNIGGGNAPSVGGGNRPNSGGGNTPSLGGGNRPSVGGGGNLGGGNRANVGSGANRPNVGGGGNRPSVGGVGGGGGRGQGALGNITSGRVANAQAARGRASLGGGGGGGGARLGGGGGGGGFRGGGGGGGRGGGGGGRRSDLRLKHDVTLLGYLPDGLGFYRFIYNGGHTAYVGVMAQDVASIRPDAVARGSDGYLRVYYDKLGLTFQTYDAWVASGGRIPSMTLVTH